MRNEASSTTDLSDRRLVWMLFRYLAPHWRELGAVFAMLLGVTLLSLLPPYLIKVAVDGPIARRELTGLAPLGLIYFVAIISTFALRFSYIILLQTAGQRALAALMQDLYEHIIRLDMRFFNATPVGQIVSRLSNDIDALTELLSTSIVIVLSNLVSLIGIVAVMLALEWRLALLGLAVLPIMTFATGFFRSKIRAAARHYHKTVGEFQAFLNEQFGGMLIVQLFGRQAMSRQEFDVVNGAIRKSHNDLRDAYTWYAATLQLMTSIGLGLVLYGGGGGVLAGYATLGVLISMIQYTQRSYEPILLLSEQFGQIQSALSAGERIARMLSTRSEIVEPEHPAQIDHFRGEIRFEDVHFRYEPDAPVLRGVNLHLPAGQTVAIVGATGAGKTSLVGLLARFYDVSAGRITLDGVDVRNLSNADLRRYVAVVPQNPYCFNGAIADNLRLFDDSIPYDQMVAAAETACCAPFIERLPGGYDYRLLPGGADLSQGQRQLLALARALIHCPDGILVLDEATSSIDTETEELIQRGLGGVLKGRTSVIIAHRLSTVRDANRILVMRRGEIVEDGNHDQLLARGGLYAELYRRQFAQIEARQM